MEVRTMGNLNLENVINCMIFSAIVLGVIHILIAIWVQKKKEENNADIRALLEMICENRRELFYQKVNGIWVPEEIVTELDRFHRDIVTLSERNKDDAHVHQVGKDIARYFRRLENIETRLGDLFYEHVMSYAR
jgi:hypothetical protein